MLCDVHYLHTLASLFFNLFTKQLFGFWDLALGFWVSGFGAGGIQLTYSALGFELKHVMQLRLI